MGKFSDDQPFILDVRNSESLSTVERWAGRMRENAGQEVTAGTP